jgi:hypothetical protein
MKNIGWFTMIANNVATTNAAACLFSSWQLSECRGMIKIEHYNCPLDTWMGDC